MFWKLFVLIGGIASISEASVINMASPDPAVKRFEAEVNALFPAHYKKMVGRSVRVEFKQLDSHSRVESPCQASHSKRVMGRTQFALFTNKPTIYIHSGFLPHIKRGDRDSIEFSCGHKNFYKMALATVIHEVSHVYDRSDRHWDNNHDRAYRQTCQQIYDTEAIPNIDYACYYYLKSEGRVSESPNYFNLIQFPHPLQSNKNQLIRGSVDPYELVGTQEHFAVNMEYFLLDPEFRCRRPSLYSYFSQITGERPFPNQDCPSAFYVTGSVTQKKLPMNPERAYEVHYLFASKGQQIMSKWGHSMFRVIMCAPHREKVGPECLQDISHHIVFSYRANISDIVLNYWDGLIGTYPSQLLAYSMGEITEEYNKSEGRDLYSLPLKLTENEKNLMVARLLEQFWSYSGKYYFLTNNCAQETDQIIKGALSRGHPYQNTYNMSPLGIYQLAELHGLTDTSILKNREEAIHKGYFFPSHASALEEAFRGIRPFVPHLNLDSYLLNSKSSVRLATLDKIPERRFAANLYLLEKQILRIIEMDLDKKIIEQVQKDEKRGRKSRIRQLIRGNSELKLKFLPWNTTSGGYGIPLENEVITEKLRQVEVEKYYKGAQDIREESLKLFPEIAKEIESSRQNLKAFFNYIKDSSGTNNPELTMLGCESIECL